MEHTKHDVDASEENQNTIEHESSDSHTLNKGEDILRAIYLGTANEIGSSAVQTPEKGTEKLSAPFVGMFFQSMELAKEYYTEYGRQNGFLTRIRTTQRTLRGQGEPNICILVCGREGKHQKRKREDGSTESVIKRSTSTIKCGCKARMRVKMQEHGWMVNIFDDSHNHKTVSPYMRKYMKTNKHMPEAAKVLSKAFYEENLPVGKVAAVLDGENISFDKRDCYNHLNSENTKRTKEGDATAALRYFQKKSAENSQFFYAIQSDNEGRAVNFFWVDGRSRLQYKNFGDVVIFDTTYKTNVYKMPFGPFTGVNHHWQSIQFGCALLQNESEESFVWLFQTWLEAMGGEYPTAIITDQDRAMNAAIAKVFPNTQHRLCLWHITKKIPEHLAHIYTASPTFKNDFHDIMETFREHDFEEKWDRLLTQYDIKDHDWLDQMYQIRKKWVTAYNMDTFYAGMKTTGRSEGMNLVYKMYFTPHTFLREFLPKYKNCCQELAKSERKEDYATEHKNRIIDVDSCLLKHAAKLYTRNIYDKFHVEWKKAQVGYRVEGEKVGDIYNTYIIQSRNDADKNEWNVNLSFKTLEGHCDCKRYEFMGIPCGHLLKIFMRFDIDNIPRYFIRTRWTQGSNQYRARDGGELLSKTKDSEVLRLCHGTQLANQIVYDCVEDKETFKMLVEALNTLSVNVSKYKESHRSDATSNISSNMITEETSTIGSQVLLNPNISQTKGRKKNNKRSVSTRIKGGLEKSQNKMYIKCNLCGKQDGHDKRNCPENPNRKHNRSKKQAGEDFDEDMDDASEDYTEDDEGGEDVEDEIVEEL